ncbi:MAG: ABC transporter substrate-binding protein [Lachnospiraceae bacterium]|nr:ABC transporter substrate-binding protein [Lachnospiraceae bacterium]
MKKILTLFIAALFIVFIISGCAEKNNGSDTPTQENTTKTSATGKTSGTEISVLHMWPEHAEEFEKIAKNFESETGIHVNLRVVPWDALTQTLMTGFASGDNADVSVCWSQQVGIFNSIGEVLDLTPYLEDNNDEWKNTFLQGGLNLCAVNGKYYAIPFRGSFNVFIYNKTLFDKYGWHEPASLEDFEREMQEMKAAGFIPIIAAGSPSGFRIANIQDNFTDQKLLADGIIMRPDYLSGHYTKVKDAYAFGGQKTREWMNNDYINKYGMAMQREEGTSLFILQRGIVTLVNNNELISMEDLAKEAGFEIGFFSFPVPEGTEKILSHCNFDSFMVSAKTKHPDEAVAFLKYLTSEEIQQEFGNKSRSVMGNSSCVYEDSFQNEFADMVASSNSYTISYDYNSGDMEGKIASIFSDFISDPEEKPEEFGAKVQKLREEVLADAMKNKSSGEEE